MAAWPQRRLRPEELGALVRNDIPRLSKIVRDSGAKMD